MNLNRKIDPIRGDGIPGYNRKINEIVAGINWLMGVRVTNGRPISESDQGPVFDLSPANMTQPAAAGQANDATDPDGYQAGWRKVTGFDFDGSITGYTNSMYQLWIWSGQLVTNIQPIPWMNDPSNNEAGWIVCKDNTTWGTGQCPTGATCTNYHNAGYSGNNSGAPPCVMTFSPGTIVPPNNCTPRFILVAYAPSGSASGPILSIVNGLTSANPSDTLSWSFKITYDGLTVISLSGSNAIARGQTLSIPLDTAGWLFDPGDIPGYGHGSGHWVYPFNGAVSANTSPQIVETFTYSSGTGTSVGFDFGISPLGESVVFMTG